MYPTSLDLSLAASLHAHATPALTQAMLLVTNLHSNLAINLMSAAFALFLLTRRQRDWLIALILAVPTGMAINAMIKHAFALSRPTFEDPLLKLDTFSFPSGHVAGATLFYGFLVAYFWRRTDRPRVHALWITAAATLVALVGFTRVYLGVHYLTDVIGAVAWSLPWLALCLLLRDRWAAR